jgi:hypothetical protein
MWKVSKSLETYSGMGSWPGFSSPLYSDLPPERWGGRKVTAQGMGVSNP